MIRDKFWFLSKFAQILILMVFKWLINNLEATIFGQDDNLIFLITSCYFCLLNRYYWLALVSSDYFSLLLVPHLSKNAYYTIFYAVYGIMCSTMQSLNINAFWSKAPFLHPLKSLENLLFSDVLLGVQNWNIGWKWVNLIITCLEKNPSKRFVARVYSVLLFIMYTLTQFMPLVSFYTPS